MATGSIFPSYKSQQRYKKFYNYFNMQQLWGEGFREKAETWNETMRKDKVKGEGVFTLEETNQKWLLFYCF